MTGCAQCRVTGVVDYGLFSQIIQLCTRGGISTTTRGVDRLKLEVHSLELARDILSADVMRTVDWMHESYPTIGERHLP